MSTSFNGPPLTACAVSRHVVSHRTRFVFVPDLSAAAYWQSLFLRLRGELQQLCFSAFFEDPWSSVSPSSLAEFGSCSQSGDVANETVDSESDAASFLSFGSDHEASHIAEPVLSLKRSPSRSLVSGPLFGFELLSGPADDEVADAGDSVVCHGVGSLSLDAKSKHFATCLTQKQSCPTRRRRFQPAVKKSLEKEPLTSSSRDPSDSGFEEVFDKFFSARWSDQCEVCQGYGSTTTDAHGLKVCTDCANIWSEGEPSESEDMDMLCAACGCPKVCKPDGTPLHCLKCHHADTDPFSFGFGSIHDSQGLGPSIPETEMEFSGHDATHSSHWSAWSACLNDCDIVCNLCGTFIGHTSSGIGSFCPFCPGTGVSIHDWEDDLDVLQCGSCNGPLAAQNVALMLCDNCLVETS